MSSENSVIFDRFAAQPVPAQYDVKILDSSPKRKQDQTRGSVRSTKNDSRKSTQPAQSRPRTSLFWTKLVWYIIILAGLIIHVYGSVTSIIYIIVTNFDSQNLYRAAIAFVILAPLIQIAVTVSGLWNIQKIYEENPEIEYDKRYLMLKSIGAVSLAALGLFDLLFLYAVYSTKYTTDEIDVFNAISKSFALVSAFFQSIPQIIIVMLNNYYTNTWSAIGILAIAGSAGALMYDSFTCIRAFEDVTKIKNRVEPNTAVQSPIVKDSFADNSP